MHSMHSVPAESLNFPQINDLGTQIRTYNITLRKNTLSQDIGGECTLS